MKESKVLFHFRYSQLQGLCAYPSVVHGFSTRRGGVSRSPFSSLNLSLDVEDDPTLVSENRRLFLLDLGIGDKPLVKVKQVHEDHILVVDQEMAAGPGFPEDLRSWPADALMTGIPGIILSVSIADCIPILLFDERRKVIAAVHAGWRSTAAGLITKVVSKMKEAFGTRPEDCVAGIGPSIGPCCYEVDEPVLSVFAKLSPDWQEWVREEGEGRWRLDLVQADQTLLLGAGIPRERIFSSGICVSCQEELFFSHRRDGKRTGRMMGVIMMRGEDD
jgi:hypothetical protein